MLYLTVKCNEKSQMKHSLITFQPLISRGSVTVNFTADELCDLKVLQAKMISVSLKLETNTRSSSPSPGFI